MHFILNNCVLKQENMIFFHPRKAVEFLYFILNISGWTPQNIHISECDVYQH